VRATAIVLGLCVAASTLHAQPAPPGDKVDAKALLASGLKLFGAKDYLGALAVFKDAYTRFPSTKILLNIGTTLKALQRNAEAANVYQRYLDAPDSDPAKKAGVTKVLGQLDASVGMVELTITPTDAEVRVDDEEWQPAAALVHYRVMPGKHVLHARRDGYEPFDKTVDAAPGATAELTLTLQPVPVVPTRASGGTTASAGETDGGELGGHSPAQPPSRYGVLAFALLDVKHAGGAARVGATVDLVSRLSAEVAALIGPSPGAYAGVRFAILGGRFRPVVAAGMPLFVSNGARIAVRGAAALEVVLSRHVSVTAEAGIERIFNAEMNYAEILFVPAIGVVGRL
jgi:hypothetical protein